MRFEHFVFGSIRIDGRTYEHDVVIDLGAVRKREKKASRPLRVTYGHTPLSILERIPWNCHRLVVGTGVHGALPIVPELSREAERRGVGSWWYLLLRRSRCCRRTHGKRTPSCT